jgi:hypothetical protein
MSPPNQNQNVNNVNIVAHVPVPPQPDNNNDEANNIVADYNAARIVLRNNPDDEVAQHRLRLCQLKAVLCRKRGGLSNNVYENML